LGYILIVGAGGMGRWFARYFRSMGYEIKVYDIDFERARSVAEEVAGIPLKQLDIKDVEVVLNAVNLSRAVEVVERFTGLGFRGMFIDISSLKKDVNSALRKGVMLPLSIHPLFGPGAKEIEDKRIVLTPIVDVKVERKAVERFFPKAKILVMDEEVHDRYVTYIIQLPQALSFLALKVMEGEEWNILMEGTSFRTLKMMIALALYNSLGLAKELLSANPNSKELLRRLDKAFKKLKKGELDVKDVRWMNLEGEYKRAYEILEG
jgi:prephenate dehydrogenase